jgi:hypothetical protein
MRAMKLSSQYISTASHIIRDKAKLKEKRMPTSAKSAVVQAGGMDNQGERYGAALPGLHGAGNALMLAFAPARVPKVEAEATIKERSDNVGQKLNYNVGHP